MSDNMIIITHHLQKEPHDNQAHFPPQDIYFDCEKYIEVLFGSRREDNPQEWLARSCSEFVMNRREERININIDGLE